jgi:alanine dehydrogenase
MNIGVPKEVKNNEFRVAITPSGVREFIKHGHSVFIEKGAGLGSAITDADYTSVGATILDSADEVWAKAELILKVKEPIAVEYSRLRKDQVLFTYLHLAASRECTDALVKSGTTAIAYETVDVWQHKLELLLYKKVLEGAGFFLVEFPAFVPEKFSSLAAVQRD